MQNIGVVSSPGNYVRLAGLIDMISKMLQPTNRRDAIYRVSTGRIFWSISNTLSLAGILLIR